MMHHDVNQKLQTPSKSSIKAYDIKRKVSLPCLVFAEVVTKLKDLPWESRWVRVRRVEKRTARHYVADKIFPKLDGGHLRLHLIHDSEVEVNHLELVIFWCEFFPDLEVEALLLEELPPYPQCEKPE